MAQALFDNRINQERESAWINMADGKNIEYLGDILELASPCLQHLLISFNTDWYTDKLFEYGFRIYNRSGDRVDYIWCNMDLYKKRNKLHETCKYPKVSTISAGITAVIISDDLKYTFVVKDGSSKRFKPITGGRNIGNANIKTETSFSAAIREVLEEIDWNLEKEPCIHVCTWYIDKFYGSTMNENNVYTFIVDRNKFKHIGNDIDGEVSKGEWISLENYMNMYDTVKINNEDKPWLMSVIIRLAYEKINNIKHGIIEYRNTTEAFVSEGQKAIIEY